jgi:hypothetical protein
MTLQTDIKRLNDGSIDYAHYIARSRVIRSHDTNQALVTICGALKAAWNATKHDMRFRRGSIQSQGKKHSLKHAGQWALFSRISHL